MSVASSSGVDWKIRILRGQANISSPRPGVVRIRYSGACVAEHATAVTKLLDQWLEEGQEVRVVVDALELDCHAYTFGRHWHMWLARNRERLGSFEVLSRSRLDALAAVPLAA